MNKQTDSRVIKPEEHPVSILRMNLDEKTPIRFGLKTHETVNDYPINDMHYELELGIVLSGQIERLYAYQKKVLKKNDIWLSGIWECCYAARKKYRHVFSFK